MPYLHGQPYKYELRKEIVELRRDLWNERKEHMHNRQRLKYARLKIEALEAKIERMAQIGRQLLVEADQEAKVELFRRDLKVG